MASSTTETQEGDKIDRFRRTKLSITFDASDGSFDDYILIKKFSGKLTRMVTNPGGTAPTNLYDLTIEDENAVDVLQGLGANLLTATTEDKSIVLSGTELHPVITKADTLTVKIANQSVNSALVDIFLYYEG